MNISEFFKLALTALWANKLRSILTMLGIIIGVASVILLVSIGTGLQEYITDTFASLGSNTVFVLPGKVDFRSAGAGRPLLPTNKFNIDLVQEINRAGNAIEQAAPMIQLNAVVNYRDQTLSIPVIGMWASVFDMRNLEPDQGNFFTQADVERSRKVVVLGPKTATDLFGDISPLRKYVTINDVRYQVIGVHKAKGGGGAFGADIDGQAYIPFTTASRQFDQERPAAILIQTTSQETVSEAADEVKRILKRHLDDDEFTVVKQDELLNTINQFLGVITVALGGIASISLLVGGIGIMNIMLVSVTERTREIGLRKAVGATPSAILTQFLIEAVVLSLVGGGLGIGLGSLGAWGLSRFIQTAVTPWSIMLAFGFSAGVGIIFGVAPAIRAARLNPIEALRYE